MLTSGEGEFDQGGNSSARHHVLPEQESKRAKALFPMKAKEVHQNISDGLKWFGR